ncbi:26S proteasome non-ATPase regulatory subunit 10-like [Sitodiplosis mosellana]|uniref:26S proteasome non-ATPase regulatory subunit 10-like n=1 Tax=Sitodiplosis mosellana TaxID=263140 RepID=UPI00244451EE|nr:26S proteasome non-ATPase regulatory subunit 10-like [Sitodiplosis mosellana]
MKSFIILTVCLSAVIAVPLEFSNDIDNNETALHMAAGEGDHDMVKKLLDLGTSVHSISNDGATSLHKAAEKGKEKTAQVLLDSGANVNSQDHKGFTPLHRSASEGHPNMVKLLIDNKADVNIAAKDGTTPLHVAFEKENAKVTETLITNGASMTIRNNDGESVLGMSIKSIENGISTIWLGVREMFAKTVHFVTNPSEAIRKTNLRSFTVGPFVRLNFDTRDHSTEDFE